MRNNHSQLQIQYNTRVKKSKEDFFQDSNFSNEKILDKFGGAQYR